MLVYFSTLLIPIIYISAQADKFKFTAKDWTHPRAPPGVPRIRHMHLKDDFTISCQTNDPHAAVDLKYKRSRSKTFQPAADKFKSRIKQNGQTFNVRSLKMGDVGYYRCVAKNNRSTIIMDLGQIHVSIVIRNLVPEIIPKQPVIYIETNGSFNVICHTKGRAGSSLLTWFRKKKDGVKVEVGSVGTKRNIGGNYFEIKKLVFKKFTAADAGDYICERQVRQTKTSRNVRIELKPDVAANVNTSASNTNPMENSSLVLRCEVTGSPRPQRSWKKNGRERQKCNDLHAPCVLQIKKVEYPRDNGIFTCTASNFVSVSKSVTIEVQVPPTLKKYYGESVRAQPNEDVELFCDLAKGNPPPTVTWYQQKCNSVANCDEKESSWEQIDTQIPNNTTRTTRSHIITPKTKASYLYRYIATNPSGKASFTFVLFRDVNKEHQFGMYTMMKDNQFDILEKDVLEVDEQDKLSIKCKMDSDVYNNATLKKNGLTIPHKNDNVDNKIVLKFITNAANLTDSGTYKCEANSIRGGPRSKSIQVKVKELLAPTIHDFKDTKIVQDSHRNYEINCNMSGNPLPKVSWKFEGRSSFLTGDIESTDKCNTSIRGIYRLTGSTNKLVVCKVDFSYHQGIYECIATNKLSSRRATMNLTIGAKPNITGWEESKDVVLSEEIDLVCKSKANPIANVSWYQIKERNVSLFLQSAIGTNYMVLKVKEGDNRYMCRATNIHGDVKEEMTLMIMKRSFIGKQDDFVMIGIGIVIVLIIVSVVIMCWYKRRLESKYAKYLRPDNSYEIDPDKSLFEQSIDLPYDQAWEFPRNRLEFIRIMGSGEFGEVWLAEASGIHAFKPRDTSAGAIKRRRSLTKTKRYHSISIKYRKQEDMGKIELEKTCVAVKKLKTNASDEEYKDLCSELKIIIHLGENKNIVNLLGACTIKGDLNVILELCPHGDLLNFLRGRKNIFQPVWFKKDADMEKEFTYIDLLMISYQVSKGMDFLQSRKCVHRDLAARNVLIGQDYVTKISDFGMARDLTHDDVYLKQTVSRLPIKWMSPESLFDKTYTSMSDVWSFGVLLWEVFSLGGVPYPGLAPENLFNFIEDGKRMECPRMCPKEMYGIMLDCWIRSPYGRPIFGQLTERIENCIKQNVHNDKDYLEENDDPAPNDNYLVANTDSAPTDCLLAVSPNKEQTLTDSISDDESRYDPSKLPPSPTSFSDSYKNKERTNHHVKKPTNDYVNTSTKSRYNGNHQYDPPELQHSPSSPTDGYIDKKPDDHYVNTTDSTSRF